MVPGACLAGTGSIPTRQPEEQPPLTDCSGCVGRQNDPIAQDPGVHEVERRFRARAVQQVANVAWSDELRIDPQLELVEEAVFEQEARDVTEAVSTTSPR